MISDFEETKPGLFSMKLLDGEKFWAWSEQKPKQVFINSKPILFDYKSGKLVVDIHVGEAIKMTITFQ